MMRHMMPTRSILLSQILHPALPPPHPRHQRPPIPTPMLSTEPRHTTYLLVLNLNGRIGPTH